MTIEKGFSRIWGAYVEMFRTTTFCFRIRGRYGSEGVLYNRPVRDAKGCDSGRRWHERMTRSMAGEKCARGTMGASGLAGISYGGGWTVMECFERIRRWKAVSEQASPADMFLGTTFIITGAFRLSYGFEYRRLRRTDKTNFQIRFDRFAHLRLGILRLGPLIGTRNAKYISWDAADLNDFVEHPELRPVLKARLAFA